MEELSHTKMKNCEYLGKAISSPLMLGGRYTPRQWSWQKFLSPQKWWSFWIFKVFAKHKNAYISKTVLYGANSTKFLTWWVSLQSSHANFQNIFVSPNIQDILNFLQNTKMLISWKPWADCADFGCHNSIRLETKHFLNALALTCISFSGCFVFDMQKHYLFFCERSSSLIYLF